MQFNSLLKKNIVRNSMWMIILQTFNMIIPLLTIPYITRILGSTEYGHFSIALNWILYFQVIVEYGFELNGARRVAINSSIENIQIIFNGIISSRLLLSLFTLIALFVVWSISNLPVSTLLCMLLLFFMVIGTSISLTWVFQGLQQMRFITIANVIARLISLLLIFLFVKSSEHIYRYCFFYSCTFFISGIIGMFICYNKYGIKFHFARLGQIFDELKDGWFLFLSAAMICIFGNIGVSILTYSVDAASIGAFSAIHKISYVMNVLFIALSKALFPYISANFAKSRYDGLSKIKKTMLPIVSIFLFLSIIISLLRNPLVNLLFGEEYTEFAFLIIPFVFQVVFAIINNFLGIQSLVGNGYQKEYSSAISIGMVSIVIFNLILINISGITGAAYASLFAEIILTLILLYKNFKIYKIANRHV